MDQIFDQTRERLNADNHRLRCVEKDCQGEAHEWPAVAMTKSAMALDGSAQAHNAINVKMA